MKDTIEESITREIFSRLFNRNWFCKMQSHASKQVIVASNSTKTKENKKDQNKNNQVKSVVIIGDSMIKHLNGWDLPKKFHKSECKIYVKSFPKHLV